MAGAQESRQLNEALKGFNLSVPPSPTPPTDLAPEPFPLGAILQNFDDVEAKEREVRFFAAWPIGIEQNENVYLLNFWEENKNTYYVTAFQKVGQGVVAVIADTFFASNQNLESPTNSFADNIAFWRWFLKFACGKPTR